MAKRNSIKPPAADPETLRALETAFAVILLAARLLKHQNCDQDADVARVLHRAAADPLQAAIVRLGGKP